MTPRRLIVGSAGGTPSFGVIRSVRERYGDRVFLVAIDTHRRELVAATALTDAFVQVPPARSPKFPDALRDLARSYPGSSYLPMHDEEILVAARMAAEGRFPNDLELIAVPYETVRLCWDKWETHRWLLARGFPSPETCLATPAALETMRHPVLLKPREGTAGKNFRTIQAASDLAGVDPDRWMLQEVLQEPEVSIVGILGRRGDFFRCLAREYIEFRQGSPSMKGRIYDDPLLTDLAERLVRALPILGAFFFEVMRDRAGEWRIIDVHPRVGAGTRMLAAVGVNVGAANIGDFWGEDVSELLPPLAGEYYVMRQYEEYVTRRPPAAGSA
jgi:carbamoyl-phosphate synthase large subunit